MAYGNRMIILDTHIWVWWNQDSPLLTSFQKKIIENSRCDGIRISNISLLEISRLVNRGRLVLPKPLKEWFSIALAEEGILLIPITPAIAIESYSLPKVDAARCTKQFGFTWMRMPTMRSLMG